jgi:hypothetical protein
MPDPRPHSGPARRLRLPRPTARLRLTVLYAVAFLVCGAAVLAVIAYVSYRPPASRKAPPPRNSRAKSPPQTSIVRVHTT